LVAEIGNQVGFGKLARDFEVRLAQQLRVASFIGRTRSENKTPEQVIRIFPASYAPEDSFEDHFEFGLKYEDIHLEFLSRLFTRTGPAPLEAWIAKEPLGQYARRACFLYEWLTGRVLDVPDRPTGNYVTALPPEQYFARTDVQRNRRWRVQDNLPGTPAFCPLVRRSAELEAATAFDIMGELDKLDVEFGTDVLMRSAVWLTFKESQASFQIEREADKAHRVRRFAHVISEHSGRIANPLDPGSLETLQRGILGEAALRMGLRRSAIFVGQGGMYQDIVHYVGPRYQDTPNMLRGLQVFEEVTRGASPLVRAAVIAFGFVYVHPMRDGNGRIHRFLINDTLQRDGAIPVGVILPVSATITNSTRERTAYDQVLETFSRPLMDRYADAYRFGNPYVAEDGTPTNFHFDAYDDASHAWRFPDLTQHAIYTATLVEKTIRHEMANEARMLVRFDNATDRLKNLVEMPNQDATRIIRAVKDNHWQVSNKLMDEYEFLQNASMLLRVVEAVQSAFEDRDSVEIVEDDEGSDRPAMRG
jgi:hypothetical protein